MYNSVLVRKFKVYYRKFYEYQFLMACRGGCNLLVSKPSPMGLLASREDMRGFSAYSMKNNETFHQLRLSKTSL